MWELVIGLALGAVIMFGGITFGYSMCERANDRARGNAKDN